MQQAISVALKGYVTKYHSKEPKWNADGVSVSEFLGTGNCCSLGWRWVSYIEL